MKNPCAGSLYVKRADRGERLATRTSRVTAVSGFVSLCETMRPEISTAAARRLTISRAAPGAGLFGGFHSLRHYFLTALARGGANLEAVRELASHSALLTTQRYLHASGAALRDAMSRLPGNAKPLGNLRADFAKQLQAASSAGRQATTAKGAAAAAALQRARAAYQQAMQSWRGAAVQRAEPRRAI